MTEALRACECGRARTKFTEPTHYTSDRGNYRIACPCCPASTAWFATEAEARAAWNRRAPVALPTREEVFDAIFYQLMGCDADGNVVLAISEQNASEHIAAAADAILDLLRRKGVG